VKTWKPYFSLLDGAVDPFRARGLWVSAAQKEAPGMGICLRVLVPNKRDAALKRLKLINSNTTGSHDVSL
jgi:hypothetical protein